MKPDHLATRSSGGSTLAGVTALASLGLLSWVAPGLGLSSIAPEPARARLLWGLALLTFAVATVALVALLRRRAYRWLAAAATLALVAFDPGQYPTGRDWSLGHRGPAWRLVHVALEFALFGAAAAAVAWMVRHTDELEQRVNLQALGFAFGLTLAVALAWALLEDVLPPLRAAWVVVLMAAGWVGGAALVARRYR
jgi:hypothetical protein